MKPIAYALVLMAFVLPAQAQVHKCKQPDGRYIYSDRACPTSTEKVAAPNLTNASRLGSSSAGFDTGPLPPIDFGSSPQQRFSKARAMISSILIDARACDWDMKVTKRFTPCAKFMQQLVDGREWSQAHEALSPLMKDDVLMQENAVEAQAMLRDMREIVKVKELAVLRAGQ